jgi:hypothetical protein
MILLLMTFGLEFQGIERGRVTQELMTGADPLVLPSRQGVAMIGWPQTASVTPAMAPAAFLGRCVI